MALLGKRFKNSLIYFLVVGVMRLMRLLPLTWIPRWGRGLGRVAYLLGRRERRRALSNLQRVFPELSPDARRETAREVFMHLGQNALECVVMSKIRRRLGTAASPVTFSPGSLERLLRARAFGRGIVFITGHLGNWELMATEVARHARVSVLSKPSYDDRFSCIINAFREKSGIRSIDVSSPGHLLQARRALKQGGVLGVLIDQPMSGGPLLPFLGRPAPTTVAAAALARWTGACVLGGFIHRSCTGGHIVEVYELKGDSIHTRDADDASDQTLRDNRAGDFARTQAYSGVLEEAIQKYPAQWVWSLDRWRSTESSGLSRHSANVVPSPGN